MEVRAEQLHWLEESKSTFHRYYKSPNKNSCISPTQAAITTIGSFAEALLTRYTREAFKGPGGHFIRPCS